MISEHINSIKAVVVDDELLARENLKMLINEFCPDIEIVGDADNVTHALEVIQRTSPDVIFLDIRMPSGAEGFELLDKIPDKKFQVVFVTAFKDYAIKAFKANAIDYILKPIDIDDLQNAVKKIKESRRTIQDSPLEWKIYLEKLENLSKEIQFGGSSKISISHAKGIKIVEADTIVRLEADGNCTKLYFVDGSSYLDTRTLKTYDDFLNPSIFFRVHKSSIINLNHLSEYSKEDGNFAIMNNKHAVSISRARLSEFIDRIKQI